MAKDTISTPSNGNGNGTSNGTVVKWLGVPVAVWIETIRTLGIGGIVIVGVLYIIQQTVPSLAEGHLEFLRTTSQSVAELKTPIQSMSTAAEQMASSARDMQRGQQEASQFFGQVRQEHERAAEREETMLRDHQRAMDALTEIQTTVKSTNNGG